MPAKLLLLFPLHYLPPSFPVSRFSAMKPVNASQVIPLFSRVFPHKLKYQSFGSLNLSPISCNTRQRQLKNHFCNNAAREFSSRSGHEVRSSRSLIEDEAELSDWVSGLNSDSFKKTRLYTDSDNDDESQTDGFWRSRGREREERGGKRRESSLDDFNMSRRQGGGRDSMGKFPRGRNVGVNLSSSPKEWELSERNSRGGVRGKGKSGGVVEGVKRKKRDRDTGVRSEIDKDGGRRMRIDGKGVRKSFLMSGDDDIDEEIEDEKGYRSFKDLIGSDEDSEDVHGKEDDQEGDGVFTRESVLTQCSSENVWGGSSQGSPGRTDSYLSETR